MDFHTKKAEDVLKELQSSQKGLSHKEIEERLKKYGKNEFKAKKKISPLMIFIQQFASPLVWILIVAAAISAFVGEEIDAIVIGAILVLIAVLGFIQEYKAEKAIEALKKMASLHAKVIRDGNTIEIDATEIVPGDILVLETGNKIPADARLLEVHSLETQEAPLTGESTPVVKDINPVALKTPIGDRHCMVYSGTVITKGRGLAIVTSTGMQTEFGKIAKMIQEVETEKTPLQQKLEVLSKWMGIGVVLIAIIVFVTGLFKGIEIIEMMLMAISLAVAAVPEGLPAVVTISLAIGVQKMVKRNALIRKLPSVETLGTVTVICSDKTGTLTKNEMTVRKLFVNDEIIEVTGSGYEPQGAFSKAPENFELLLKIGALNNDSKIVQNEKGQYQVMGDPTEGCLKVVAQKAGINVDALAKESPRLDEIPFTSETKRMITVHEIGKKKVVFVKGAPDMILESCERILINSEIKRLTGHEKKKILEINEKFASEALRVLGFAYKPLEGHMKKQDYDTNLVFVGLQGMIDPPREECKEAVAKCKTAGIKPVMITGDHITTAIAIARELGIEGKAVLGADLEKIDLDKEVEDIAVYARVNPEDKLKIVAAFQKKGHVVAMTGDGVNDAPAIKKADMGISMGITGTDVAKEASSMVLTDDNFASIVNAVEEGRAIYDNIKKYVNYLLSSNIAEVLIIFLAIMIGLPLPLIALQILWINLVTDGPPAIALGVDPAVPGIMNRKPRPKKENIITKWTATYMLTIATIMTIGTLGIFWWALSSNGWSFGELPERNSHEYIYATTVAFTTLVLFQLVNVFNSRSEEESLFKTGIFSNIWLWISVIFSAGLQIAVIYVPSLIQLFRTTPLGLTEWLIIIPVTLTVFAGAEILKFLHNRDHKQHENI
ncbi:MAG: calcium-translocating P-type ATPase, SERCA-type [Candidatus Woesearchaeota archaeon]